MTAAQRPRLAVFKFASCDGCQLSLLDCEEELLAVAEAVDIVNFPEASRRMLPGPYDIALVEGSITTPADRERIRDLRAQSRSPDLYRRLRHGRRYSGPAQSR
jgi:sulfhydrogenase subunit delta